jgi:geranylgeranyl diphosphate synthase type I
MGITVEKGKKMSAQSPKMLIEPLKQVAALVEARLSLVFEEVRHTPPTPLFSTKLSGDLLDEIRELTMRGGKRLRAALVIYGAGLFDATAATQQAVLDTAAAMELLHTYLLIHDDLMDHDEIRRGGPSVHAALARKTESLSKGRDLAILAGDLASALSQVLLAGVDTDRERFFRLNRIFSAMHLDVVHGQTIDLYARATPTEIAIHKTASYTTVGPLCAGAAIAGAGDEEILHLAQISMPLGVAFQYRDDFLGTFGQSDKTGKSSKSDLREGKRTILIEEGLARADDVQKVIIKAVLGNANATDNEVKSARETLEQCGARRACQDRISKLVDDFVSGIEKPDYQRDSVSFLVALAKFIGNREI